MKANQLNAGIAAALAGFALASRASAAVDPNFQIYLAFGQSNMEGVAPPESQDQVANARFKSLVTCTCAGRTQGQWIPAVAPIVRPDTQLGVLDWFGRTMADSLPSNITIGVVPVAVGGPAITGFIQSAAAAYYSSQPTWMQTFAANYNGNPYTRLVAMAKVAQQTGVIKGILMHQGETDGSAPGWGDTVKTIYNSLLTDLNLKAADVPFLAGEVYNNTYTNKAIDALPQAIPTAHMISSQGLSIGTYTGNQGVHFSAESYREFGKRYAQQMLKLLPKSTSVSPAPPGIPGLRVESSARGISIHSDVAFDRVSLVSVQGREVVVGSGKDVRIQPGQFRPGVYFLRAATGASVEFRTVLVER